MAMNVVTTELSAAATRADDAGGELSQMISALMQNLEPMRQGMKGLTGTSFQQIKGQVNDNLVDMVDALNEVASGIRSSGRDFDVADSEAQAELNTAAQSADDIISRLRGGS